MDWTAACISCCTSSRMTDPSPCWIMVCTSDFMTSATTFWISCLAVDDHCLCTVSRTVVSLLDDACSLLWYLSLVSSLMLADLGGGYALASVT